MPGPRKKPTVLEELHGRPGHRKRNPLEPKLGGDLLTPPGWLAYASDHSYRLARSILPGKDDLQELMVSAGWAWAYTAFSDQ